MRKATPEDHEAFDRDLRPVLEAMDRLLRTHVLKHCETGDERADALQAVTDWMEDERKQVGKFYDRATR